MTYHWSWGLYISLQFLYCLDYFPDWNRATDYNNKPTWIKIGEKIVIEKKIRKVTWSSKILKTSSLKIGLVIFLQQSSKIYCERRRDDSLMLATIHDDTRNVLNVQHIIPNSKRWDYSDIPGGGKIYIKGPSHMAEGGHHIRKASNRHPWPPPTIQIEDS